MKYSFFTAPALQAGGFLQRVLRAPQTSVALACTLIIFGALGALGLSLASSPAVSAGGTCQPAPYGLPSPLPLASAASGLSIQDDGVTHYGVGGSSVSAIRGALTTCAPSFTGSSTSGEFLAYTSYSLDWDYRTANLPDGSCKLTDVKVGLHLSQLQPELLHAGALSAPVQHKWDAFKSGLIAHENGHKHIDTTEAAALLATLRAIHGDCSSVARAATAATGTAMTNLLSANADHDTATDYGRDQGARW